MTNAATPIVQFQVEFQPSIPRHSNGRTCRAIIGGFFIKGEQPQDNKSEEEKTSLMRLILETLNKRADVATTKGL